MTERTNHTNLDDLARIGELLRPERLSGLARDAAYVAVGLGVLGVQRAQVQRVELQKRLASELDRGDPFERLADRIGDQFGELLVETIEEARSAVTAGVQQLDELFEEAGRFVEGALQPIGEQLPPPVREIAQRAQDGAKELGSQIRGLLTSA